MQIMKPAVKILWNYKKKAESRQQDVRDSITLNEALTALRYGVKTVIEKGHVQKIDG